MSAHSFKPMSGAQIVRAIIELSDRLDLTIAEISALSGTSPVTVCKLRSKGLAPRNRPTLRRLSRFVAAAQSAADRFSLGLPS